MNGKLAFRSLWRSPGFTALAVIILSLGIGANTAIFSVVHGVILRPLPYPDPDRLVSISAARKTSPYLQVAGPNFVDMRKDSTGFETMAAYAGDIENVVINSAGEFVGVVGVSQDFFRTFAVQPIAGRLLIPADWAHGPAKIAVVGQSFWNRHFGTQPFIPGQQLKTENTIFEVVGIVPDRFHFPEQTLTEIWVPIPSDLPTESRSAHNYRVVGRLKAGVTLAGAQAQIATINDRLRSYPGSDGLGVNVTPLVVFDTHSVRTSLLTLLGAVALILLIACANIANLLLVRGAGRVRELSIRAALGADALQLTSQLLVESLILAVFGSLGGVGIAYVGLPALLAAAPRNIPRLEGVAISPPVLLFSVFAGISSILLFGLLPAWQAGRIDPNTGLRAGGSQASLGGSGRHWRQAFVIAEIALCTILLASAGLLLKSFSAMTSVPLGFHPEGMLVAEIGVPGSSRQAVETFFKPLLARLQASGEIQASALACSIPGYDDSCSNGNFVVSGQSANNLNIASPWAVFNPVSPDFFKAFQIPLTAGRGFTERDDAVMQPVAMINETLARHQFPHGNAVGQKILCGYDDVSGKWMTIVGVVRDAHLAGPAAPPAPEIFMPYRQHPRTNQFVFVRPGENPLAFAATFRNTIRKLDGTASVKFSTIEDHLAAGLAASRFNTILTSLFAGLAIALAAIGLYAVIAYSVAQRTSEMGLRLALGANRVTILGMVLQEGLRLTGVGLLIGAAGALAATRTLQSQLFNVSPSDPATYILTTLLLIAITLLASYLPAWRASHTEPLKALRHD